MKNHPMVSTLLHLKGNARACVYTEPMWGIPYNLYGPYMSVYMLALGLNDEMIGLIATIGTLSQVFFSILGGLITDKLGRHMTTFIFDIVSWSIPAFIWTIAQDFKYFLVAIIINGIFRVTAISWNALLVEDTPKEQLVAIYTWVYIAALGTGFFSPLAGIAIEKFSLIPTMRFIFGLTFVLMTAKFIILYFFSTETELGKQKMIETKDESFTTQFKGYASVIKQIISTKETMFLLGFMLVLNIQNTIFINFWAINAVDRIGIPMFWISIFPMLKSIIYFAFYFFLMPHISVDHYKKPLQIALVFLSLSALLMVVSSRASSFLVFISVVAEAGSLALIKPMTDSLQVTLVDPKERARIIGVLFTTVLLLTAPFGWISGLLSSVDRRLPFILLFILLILTVIWTHMQKEGNQLSN